MLSLDRIVKINDFMIGIWKVAYLNVLWIVFSLLGLGIFGVGPATYAMMKYYDRWLRCEKALPVAKTFWSFYKERWKQSVLISWIGLGIIFVLTVNIFNVTEWYLQVGNVMMLALTVVGMTHIYNVMAALKFQTIREIVRASFMMGLGYLHYTIILWTVVISLYYLLSVNFISLLFLFGIGFIGFCISFVGKRIVMEFEASTEDKETKNILLKGESK